MKVLLIGQLPVEAGGSYTDGVCNVVYELGKNATPEVQVVVYATNMRDKDAYALNLYCRCRGTAYRPLRIIAQLLSHPLRTMRLIGFYKKMHDRSLIRNIAYQDNICRILGEEEPDIVHCMNLIQMASAFKAIEDTQLNTPLVLTLHGVDRSPHCMAHYVIPLASRVTGLTEETIEGISIHGVARAKIAMISNGVDTTKFFFSGKERSFMRRQMGIDEDTTVLMTVASLSQRKGQYDFLCNLVKLPADFKYKYFIIGIGPDVDRIQSFIEGHSLSGIVYLVGYVHNSNLYKYYSAADIYIHSSYSEGQALSEIEAYATDLKIAVNEAVAKTIVTDTNRGDDYFFFNMKGFSSSSFVDWARKHKVNRETRRMYDWSEVFLRYSELYHDIIARPEREKTSQL